MWTDRHDWTSESQRSATRDSVGSVPAPRTIDPSLSFWFSACAAEMLPALAMASVNICPPPEKARANIRPAREPMAISVAEYPIPM